MNPNPTQETTTLRLTNFTRSLDEPEDSLRRRAADRAGVDLGRLRGFRIARQSVDARRGRNIQFVCHVDLIVDASYSSSTLQQALRIGTVKEVVADATVDQPPHPSLRRGHVVIVGTGPGGVFAAWMMLRNGVNVTLIDRGDPIEERSRHLVAFHRRRGHDADSNLLFGEGGAGTYSDGKLYTRVDHALEVNILEELVACGAPNDILFDARAHIGTDRLHRILPALRQRLEAHGGSFLWRTRLSGLVADEGGRIRAIATNQGELPCDALLLAIGHSARDTWEILERDHVRFEPKPFQFGVRVEHPQAMITRAQYGSGKAAQLLGAASYNLICKGGPSATGNEPGAHSFCMCPGGRIVASISEGGHLCTNGMSNSRHSTPYANAAIVTTFGPDDYAPFGNGPFSGVAFQRHFERRFFEAGGADYTAPAQRVSDFLRGRASVGEMKTSYIFGTRSERIDQLLPEKGRVALTRGLLRFDRSIPGFAGEDGILVGVESRSSGPVRIPRDKETRLAEGFQNLYPIGEGAGYAGGIMSAAIDGALSAAALLRIGLPL